MMCHAAALYGLDKNLDQRAMDLPQSSPSGTESKVGLEVTPIAGVTLSDGKCPGEGAPTCRYGRFGGPLLDSAGEYRTGRSGCKSRLAMSR